jgi:hypothetical protein
MRASTLGRIHPPVCAGDREASDQKHPIGRDFEPAESTEAQLVRDVAAQDLEECVNRIVTHGSNLIGVLGVIPDVRELLRSGYGQP